MVRRKAYSGTKRADYDEIEDYRLVIVLGSACYLAPIDELLHPCAVRKPLEQHADHSSDTLQCVHHSET